MRFMPTNVIRSLFTALLLSLGSTTTHAENIEFLNKAVIEQLTSGVYEVVVPKQALESDKIRYAKALPFDRLSYKERSEKYLGIGTAFFIDDKRLMSAAHVFGLEVFSLLLDDIAIRDNDGNIYPIRNVHEYSTVRDMIIFDLGEYPEKITPLAINESIEIGDTVFSVGNVRGEGISFRAGQVAAYTVEEEFGLWDNIRFTSPASPGNSGGPLVNVDGEVVGLIVQRNMSENHNIAYPIAEMNNLSGSADFHYRNIGMYLNEEQNSHFDDWQASFPLPRSITEVASRAQQSLHKFYIQLGNDLAEKYQERYFPNGERFHDYLRDQQYVRHFGVLRSDADFKRWYVSSYRSDNIPLDKDQELHVSKTDIAGIQLVIEKPADMPLQDFITDPKLIMDTMLEGLPLKRDFGVDQIRIVSLGEPERSTTWNDRLGRVWTSSLWYLNHEDSFVYSHCLPYPKGVICTIDKKTNDQLRTGYLELTQTDYDEIVVGYAGEIKDWVEYFSLDRKFLPQSMHAIRLSFEDGHFQVNSEPFKVNMEESDITESSVVHFHFGYATEPQLREDLLLYEVYPKKGDSSHYRVQKFHSPGEFSSDSHKSTWDDIINDSGDYAGKLVEKEGTFYVNQPQHQTQSSTKDGIESILVLRCVHNKRSDDILEQCEEHASAVEFK